MRLTLPYPHKALWPNGRPHWAEKAREAKKHKQWAWAAVKARNGLSVADGPVPIHVTVYPKPKGPAPDKDNVIASLKAYQDGIAAAIGIDDKHFAAPTVSFSDVRSGQFVIEVGNYQ